MATAIPHATESYRTEVDQISAEDWSELLNKFADASIYQTWPYEQAVHPRSKVSRMVVYVDEAPVGLVQVSLILVPIIRRGLAYIRSGPLWCLRNEEANPDRLRICLRAIVEEYLVRRRLMVRIVTALNSTDDAWVLPLFEGVGFRLCRQVSRKRTIIVNLSPSLQEILAGSHNRWRNRLNSGRKKEHELKVGRDDADFAEFDRIYLAMRARKQFETTTSFDAYRRFQGQLQEREKMIVILCRSTGTWHSGVVISAIGDRGIYLFGGTTGEGLQTHGSYLVQWRAIELFKEMGCRECDLNGINPETNPTTYHFKSRLAGRNGRDVTTFGAFDVCGSPISSLVVNVAGHSFRCWRALKKKYNSGVPALGSRPAEVSAQ